MRQRTLLRQLVAVQSLVVALACSALVLAGLTATAFLLRRVQNQDLLALAVNLCRGIREEAHEEGLDWIAAAHVFFAESSLSGTRFELVDRAGHVLASAGRLRRSLEVLRGPAADGACETLQDDRMPWVTARATRACRRDCDADYAVRVAARDALAEPHLRRFSVILILALPLAVFSGAALGRTLFRRWLRPLRELQEAAARLTPDSATALGVGARAVELAELERAFDSLLQRLAQALSREKRFTHDASHELRTPLTLLRGRIELLCRDLGSDPARRAEAQAALCDVQSLERLVEALLLLARSDSAALPSEPVNVCDLARETAERQSRMDGGAGPSPEVDAPEEILVRGSEELLARCLANLVGNARKFAGPSARIRIRVFEDDGRAVIRIDDSGPGISPGIRPYLFDRFVRGPEQRRDSPGAGLGLAVVRTIALRHGGDVQVGDSDLGGAAFSVSLPLLLPAPRRAGDPTGAPRGL